MDRDQVLSILRSHEAELRAAGVERLQLFGSVARGDQTPESDVDLALELRPDAHLGFALAGLQANLSSWLMKEVDVLVLGHLRPALADRVLREAVSAF